MADDRNPVRRALAERLPMERAARVKITRRGVALVVGLAVLLLGSGLGLNDVLATLLAICIGLLWLKFGPPGRETARRTSD